MEAMTWKLIVVAAVVLVGCGGDDDVAEPSLVAADDVRAEQATDGTAVAFGEPAELEAPEGGSVVVTVSDPVMGGDDGGPWLTVDVRVENATDASVFSPQFAIRCAGEVEAGGYQAGSTYSQAVEVPAGSFDEGTLNLLLPGDGRYGEPIPECAEPAAIVVETLVQTADSDRLVIALPAELIGAFNDAAAAFAP